MGAPVKDRLCVLSPLLGAMVALQGRFSASRWTQEFAQRLMAKPRLGTQSPDFRLCLLAGLGPYERAPSTVFKAQNPFILFQTSSIGCGI
jgi:hypothetical protein